VVKNSKSIETSLETKKSAMRVPRKLPARLTKPSVQSPAQQRTYRLVENDKAQRGTQQIVHVRQATSVASLASPLARASRSRRRLATALVALVARQPLTFLSLLSCNLQHARMLMQASKEGRAPAHTNTNAQTRPLQRWTRTSTLQCTKQQSAESVAPGARPTSQLEGLTSADCQT